MRNELITTLENYLIGLIEFHANFARVYKKGNYAYKSTHKHSLVLSEIQEISARLKTLNESANDFTFVEVKFKSSIK